MRILFAEELAGKQDEAAVQCSRINLDQYFKQELNKTCLCWYAAVDNEPASIACVVLRKQPPSIKNPSGRWGYLMNVYTLPQYRKMGLSSAVLRHLEQDAASLGITAFELHATAGGAPVYEKNGYIVHNEPTYRKFV